MSIPAIDISNLKTWLGGQWVHDNLSLQVEEGEILGVVGGSGSGKSTLLRNIVMLEKPVAGSIKVFDKEVVNCKEKDISWLQHHWGFMFQSSALFTSLNVLENIMFPLREQIGIAWSDARELAMIKLELVGLSSEVAIKYPAELSGGMQKRVALARAIAIDPDLLFLDEPTAGLDPHAANAFDELIISLQKSLALTIMMVTHDVDSLWQVTDRIAFLGEGKVLAVGPIAEVCQASHPLIQDYFSGPRGRAAREANSNI